MGLPVDSFLVPSRAGACGGTYYMTWSLKKFLSFRVKEIGECRPKADTVVGAEPLLLHVFFKEIN